jgi:hypothetical protein
MWLFTRGNNKPDAASMACKGAFAAPEASKAAAAKTAKEVMDTRTRLAWEERQDQRFEPRSHPLLLDVDAPFPAVRRPGRIRQVRLRVRDRNTVRVRSKLVCWDDGQDLFSAASVSIRHGVLDPMLYQDDARAHHPHCRQRWLHCGEAMMALSYRYVRPCAVMTSCVEVGASRPMGYNSKDGRAPKPSDVCIPMGRLAPSSYWKLAFALAFSSNYWRAATCG